MLFFSKSLIDTMSVSIPFQMTAPFFEIADLVSQNCLVASEL